MQQYERVRLHCDSDHFVTLVFPLRLYPHRFLSILLPQSALSACLTAATTAGTTCFLLAFVFFCL